MFTDSQNHQHHQRRAFKRQADENEPEVDQPITKRLARMRIGQPDQRHFQPTVTSPDSIERHETRETRSEADDCMYVDDTKDRIYIHDLESEIAQIEAEEPKAIFLPDIERKISAIPEHLLQNNNDTSNTQMVLYHIPASISVPEERDHVRRAILAARTRAREKQDRKTEDKRMEEERNHDHGSLSMESLSGLRDQDTEFDAMDLG